MIKKFWIAAALLSVSLLSAQAQVDNMKAYPAAEEGMVRYVVQLPEEADEALFKVELQVGKIVNTDAENRYFFSGRIEENTVEGWGYPKYEVKKLGAMAGTLMMPDPNAPKVDRFITLGGEPYLIRYNSKLPVVVYVPEGVEVRYRIWRADKKLTPMKAE
ncbi:MAG: ecotin family protein [Pontiellaceae bacterium]|nr:ecotin family protein [Pontiellaceae bacterium]